MTRGASTSRVSRLASRLRKALEAHPFTFCLFALIGTTAVITGGFAVSDVIAHTGYSPNDTGPSGLLRATLSAFVTADAKDALVALAAILALVGMVEHRAGTFVAAIAFWGAHFATLVGHSAISWLARTSGWALGKALVLTRDVGPSAGYVGTLGLLLMLVVPQRFRWLAVGGVGVLLTAVLVGAVASGEAPRLVSADLAHVIAFGVGTSAGMLADRLRVPQVAA